mgnify:CR=1 FL=1
MLDAALKTQLGEYLTRLREPVELAASLDDGASSRELAALLDDIASLSDKVTVVRRDDDARVYTTIYELAGPEAVSTLRPSGATIGCR